MTLKVLVALCLFGLMASSHGLDENEFMEADSDLNEVKNQIDVAEDFAPEENDDNDEINDPKNRVKRLATFRCLFKFSISRY